MPRPTPLKSLEVELSGGWVADGYHREGASFLALVHFFNTASGAEAYARLDLHKNWFIDEIPVAREETSKISIKIS